MSRRLSQQDPVLSLEYFSSGFFTYRSQLFSPFKGIGVNVVQFRDPVIAGSNEELTDLFQWSRRPGYSIFCPIALPDGEIVNQYYSFRNLNGTVLPWVDTTRRLALFSSTSLTTVLNKTTAQQGYVTTIGNMSYLSDGASADLTKYDGMNLSVWGLAAPTTIPTSTGMGFWQPDTHYNLGNSIQDTNGNIESVSAILVPNGTIESPTAFYNLALAGSTGSGWSGTIGPNGTVSNTVTPPAGYTDYVFFGNGNFAIPSGATILGVTVSMSKEILGGTAVDESVKLVIGGAVSGVDHASATPWNNSALTTVTYGTPTDNWGGLTPSQANANGSGGFGVAIAADVLSTTFYNLVQQNTHSEFNGTSGGTSNTSILCPLLNPVTAGNTIVLGVLAFHEGVTSVHDNQGNTYNLAVTQVNGEGIVSVYVASNVVAGPTTITVTMNSLNFNSCTILNAHEFRGILSASPVAATASAHGGTTTGAVVLTSPDSLIFSYLWGGATETTPAGYTLASSASIFDPPGSSFTAYSYAAFDAPGATGSFSPTWTSVNQGCTVVLKSAESATAVIGAGSPNLPIITIYYQLPSGVGPGFSGNNEPIWPVNLGTSVNDGGLAWTNYGPAAVWYPLTNYPLPIVILDTNGFLQLAISVADPVQPWSASTTYAVGNVVSFGGNFWISTTGSNMGIAPNSNYSVAVTSGSTVTTTAYWALASNPVITGSIAPVWNTTIGGTTVDGSYTWTNIGQGSQLAVTGYAYVYGFRTIYGHLTTASPYSNNTGAILGPLNGSISGFSITSNVVTFFGSDNFIPGNVFTVTGLVTGTYLNEQTFTVLTAVPSQIFPLTSVAVSAGVLTIQAINNLVAGQQVTFSSVGTATFLNGVTVTVLSGGLSGTQFEANFPPTTYGPTADTGDVLLNGSWSATFTPAVDTGGLVADAGQALPLISTVTGVGTASPLCNSVATITGLSISGNLITLIASNNFQPGIWITISGLSTAPYLNGQQFQVISVDQPVGTQNTQFQIFYETGNATFTPDSGTATFNAVEIYRTSDGGGQYLFDGAVTNPGAFLPWTFNDFVPDANLDVLLEAALNHQNDPPPGGPGSTITTAVGTISAYWNGRIWLAVGNYVYFDAGPDCTNGIPEESWPPGNRFQFAGPVIGLEPMQSGAGLIVYLADRVNVILGGPETISFYPDDFLTNFGIANPNAVFKDGSLLGQFTTQAYYTELLGKERQDIGQRIADYLSENFNPLKTYVTTHRNGLDTGVFISNGVDRIVRYGTNISAWSVPAFPVFGAGALRSIETSVGIYSLMTASPTGGVTGTIATINPTSGTSAGTGTAWLTPSNITLGNPTSYATVTFAAAGLSQALRAASYTLATLPTTAVVQGIQVAITGKQSEILGDLSFTIAPTNAVAGATTHTGSFGTSNTTLTYGSATDTWNMPSWMIPTNLVNGALSFDITATYTGASTPEMFISEVQVTITYQNPGNYLYARDINSWGDCGGFGLNNGTPYSECDIVLGSITLTQPGARLLALQHIVGYFDAVGNLGNEGNGGPSYPNIWIMPNEISNTKGIGFVQLPEVIQEPPIGQNHPSQSLLALRWNVNMMNSSLASQFVHHLQIRVQFEPENAPNTIKSLALGEDQST